MKKYLYLAAGICMFFPAKTHAQRTCGFQQQMDVICQHNPTFAGHLQSSKSSLQTVADQYRQGHPSGSRTSSSAAPVPVVFHILVDSQQLNDIGGIAGIRQRCDSQIAVLNRDYNAQNADSTLIPTGWKPLFGSVGIHFGLARIDPSGNPSPGYELRVVSVSGFDTGASVSYGFQDRYASAKHHTTGGLDAWDNTRYMNVWCINFADNTHLLGTTIAKSWTPAGGCDTSSGFSCPSNDDQGICINYEALGKRASVTDLYPAGIFDQGRTLTHEVGHFFEIWHVWGDDGGLCPWSGGADDGFMDTPPQTTSTSGNPGYTLSGGTKYDGCKDSSGVNVQPHGIACLDFLDYTDDAGMHLFTPDQAAAMASMVDRIGGENYGLVRYPELTAAVPVISADDVAFSVSPNPSTGLLTVVYDYRQADLRSVEVTDVTGRTVLSRTLKTAAGIVSLDMREMAKGIYFVRCNFAAGINTRKILLQ